MKAIPLVLLVLLSLAASGRAGEIYGSVKSVGGPVKQAKVTIKSPNQTVVEGKTDDSGSYRITVAETGKCTITVEFEGKAAQGDVQSYPTPVRFDWLMEQGNNGWSLKRQ